MAQRISILDNNDADVLTLTRASADADTLTLAVVTDAGPVPVTLDNDTSRDLALAILAWVGKAPRAVTPKDTDAHATGEAIEAAIAAGEADAAAAK